MTRLFSNGREQRNSITLHQQTRHIIFCVNERLKGLSSLTTRLPRDQGPKSARFRESLASSWLRIRPLSFRHLLAI